MKANYRELKRARLHEKELEEKKNKSFFKAIFKIKPAYAFLLFSILVFLGIYFYSYQYTVKPVNLDELPVVKRDPSYLRIVPEDRGGIIFSNQDKEIYNSITTQNIVIEEKPKTKQMQPENVSDLITRVQTPKEKPKNLLPKPKQKESRPKQLEQKVKLASEKSNKVKADKKSFSSVFDVIEKDK